MKIFTELLSQLPTIDHLDGMGLYQQEQLLDTIPNQPGKAGSLRVYNNLYERFGQLDAEAAKAGLALFAEHVADAKAHPGKHPNIDRLFAIIANNDCLTLRPIAKCGVDA